MLTLSSIFSGWEFCSVNHASKYENSESKVFENIYFFVELSTNWQNVYKTLRYCR